MISKSEIRHYMQFEPKFNTTMCSMKAAPKIPATMVGETKKAVALARKFNKMVVNPYASDLDIKMQKEPDYLPWEFVEKANAWGFYTMWIPKVFGGKGYNGPSFACFLEEIASTCLAMANLISAHYSGVVSLLSNWNIRLSNRILTQVRDGELNGHPCLLSLAITEPGAGTDVAEINLVDKGNVSCHAEKSAGGYRINGSKIFISGGHLSTWHITIGYSDLCKPSETHVMFAAKTGTDGFSFGQMKRKMGQKGCPASELTFKDCFIPDELICFDSDHVAMQKRSSAETALQVIDYLHSVSRVATCALGVGAARGAFSEALDFSSKAEVDNRLLINHEWVQCLLAEMYSNIYTARLTYNEANYANTLYGMFNILQAKPVYYFLKFLPNIFIKKCVSPFIDKQFTTWLLRKRMFDRQTDEQIRCTSGWASLAKFTGTDAGMKNARLALEIMGEAGVRHSGKAEKILRDAKLLQIYEGTNQLNRLNLFKCHISSGNPEITMFNEDGGHRR